MARSFQLKPLSPRYRRPSKLIPCQRLFTVSRNDLRGNIVVQPCGAPNRNIYEQGVPRRVPFNICEGSVFKRRSWFVPFRRPKVQNIQARSTKTREESVTESIRVPLKSHGNRGWLERGLMHRQRRKKRPRNRDCILIKSVSCSLWRRLH